MGTPCAVVFANLYLVHHQLLVDAMLSNSNTYLLYKRFIDDIFMPFKVRSDAVSYIEAFNSISPSIQIESKSVDIDDNAVHILDVMITKTGASDNSDNTKFTTDLFVKPLNKFMYLPPNSFHPGHTFPSWIKSELNRIRLICSNDDNYGKHRDSFKTHLLDRGYMPADLNRYFLHNPSRVTLLESFRNNKCSSTSLVTNKSHTASPLCFVTEFSNISLSIKQRDIVTPDADVKFFEVDSKSIFNDIRIAFKNQRNLSRLFQR
jgi:hypothetical protein